MSQHDDTTETLPAAIIARLAADDRRVSVLTPDVDRAIAQAAAAQFHARRRRPALSTAPLWGLSAAAAAALVFVVIAVRDPLPRGGAPLPGTAPALERAAATGDYDGSGTVDVLDAWWLSRELAGNPRFAANESVDSLMQRIVALEGGLR